LGWEEHEPRPQRNNDCQSLELDIAVENRVVAIQEKNHSFSSVLLW